MLLHQLFLYLNIYPKRAHSRPQEVPPFCEEMRSTFPPEEPTPCLVLSCQYKYKEYCYLNMSSPEEHCRASWLGRWPWAGKRGAFSSVSQSHSPGFGPVFTTSDPDSFWQQLNEMHALGGGDEPEMCLSALEVCSPPLPCPFPPPPRSPGLTIKGARASLGPTLHPIFRTWCLSTPLPVGLLHLDVDWASQA